MSRASLSLLLAFVLGQAWAQDNALSKFVDVDVQAGALAKALVDLSNQSGTQIVMSSEAVKDRVTEGVHGKMVLRDALIALLKGTALGFHPVGANTIGIDPAPSTIPVHSTEKEPEVPPDKNEDKATVLDTVAVTATKRLKSQRDIPGSVAALSGDTLEKMHAQGMRDYFKIIPGVVYLDQGNEESIPVIRGIATDTGNQIVANTVGIFLDDMPFADLYFPLSTPDMNPFDLDRVEVLKGPQGTLFGASALAGAVRYIVHRPDHDIWEAKFSETLARTEGSGRISPVTAGAINVPLFGDAIAIRAVGVARRDPGLYDFTATDSAGNPLRKDLDADKLKQTSYRVLASWNPLEKLKLSAFYFGQKTHSNEAGVADNPSRPENGEDPSTSPVQFPFPSPRDHDFGGANLLATYDLDWATLVSSTNRLTKHNYFDQHDEFTLGLGAQNQNKAMVIFGSEVKGYTQELRIASPQGGDGNWEWVGGLSYLNYRNDFWQFFWIGPAIDDPTSPDQITPEQKQASQVFYTLTESAQEEAVFGEVTRHLGEHWEATLGLRWFGDELVADTVICGAQTTVLAQSPSGCRPDHGTTRERGVNPKLALRYMFSRSVQLYALVAKGFQFGGFQVNPPFIGYQQSAQASGFAFAPYKSSDLWNYEGGIRTEWFHRRLRFDLTAFYLDWKDLQLNITVPYIAANPIHNINFNFETNVGRAHSEGLEAALEVAPFSGAKWTSSAALIKARTDEQLDVSNTQGPIPSGTKLPGTPKVQWSNVVSYVHPMPFFTSWLIGPVLTHSHIGSAPNALRATGTVGGFDTVDFRLALTKPDSRFLPELSVGVNNLTDVRGVTTHTHDNAINANSNPSNPATQDYDLYHFVPPRTFVLSVGFKY